MATVFSQSSGAAAQGAYKVDISRGQRIGRVSSEWFSRPDDERFRALQALVKQRKMSKTEAVPCIVREDDAISAEEDSLAENVHREPLHPLDQFRAMQQLVEQGTDVETIAAIRHLVVAANARQHRRDGRAAARRHGQHRPRPGPDYDRWLNGSLDDALAFQSRTFLDELTEMVRTTEPWTKPRSTPASATLL